MRSSERVDVMTFHFDYISFNVRWIDRPTVEAVKFVTIHAFEHDTFTVDFYQRVFDFDFSEADILRDDFDNFAG